MMTVTATGAGSVFTC